MSFNKSKGKKKPNRANLHLLARNRIKTSKVSSRKSSPGHLANNSLQWAQSSHNLLSSSILSQKWMSNLLCLKRPLKFRLRMLRALITQGIMERKTTNQKGQARNLALMQMASLPKTL